MPNWAKVDIDGLVERLAAIQARDAIKYPGKRWYNISRDLYLAAGLTAFGAPKPEKVRCCLYPNYYPDGRPLIQSVPCSTSEQFVELGRMPRTIPGTFVPD